MPYILKCTMEHKGKILIDYFKGRIWGSVNQMTFNKEDAESCLTKGGAKLLANRYFKNDKRITIEKV